MNSLHLYLCQLCAQLAAAAEQEGWGKRRKDSERPAMCSRPRAAKLPRASAFARILFTGWRESSSESDRLTAAVLHIRRDPRRRPRRFGFGHRRKVRT